jgi:hypothetical protein
MATLRKYETVTDMHVYEVELTDEQLKIYQEDEDRFWDEIADDLDWDFSHDKAGDPEIDYELLD